MEEGNGKKYGIFSLFMLQNIVTFVTILEELCRLRSKMKLSDEKMMHFWRIVDKEQKCEVAI